MTTPTPTFVELFDDVAARHPDEIAVSGTDEQLTYTDLADRTRRLGRTLIARGVGPEDVVAVVADRSSEDWLVGLLGVLQSGAAYLTLDPAYPAERVAFMLDDARPRLVLHAAGVPWPIEPADVPSARIGDLVADVPGAPPRADERLSPLGPENLAYVIYTSGSTGRPKGVAVTHRGMQALADTQDRVVGTGVRDQVLQWASPSFDAAFWDLTLALLHGSTLHLAPAEDLLPGEPLRDTLLERGITHATLPPVALGALDALDEGDVLQGGTVVSTGDTCTQGVVDTWAPGRTLINGYGPTETTVGATLSAPLVPGEEADIGVPFDGARVDVVDPGQEPVPAGQVGELMVGGEGVARGYLGRPRLTAERFRPDPHADDGERVYLTGDLGHRRRDGRFQFGGRGDDQVKLRGFRIELGEIEAALVRHPDVQAAAVAVRSVPGGEDGIVAWVMAPAGRTDADSVRRFLAEGLPAHMVPALIGVHDRLPTTAHGKIDRKALVTPEVTAVPEKNRGTDDLESSVIARFAAALKTEPGPEDNFFDLGGDSIRFTGLIGKLNREHAVKLPLKQAFTAPTARDLARLISEA